MKPSYKRCLLAISEEHIDMLLPGSMVDRLAELFHFFHIINPENYTVQEFHQLMHHYDPHVIVTGWSTPLLEEKYLDYPDVSLEYLCNLTGGLRTIVPRCLLEKGLLVTNWGNAISHIVAEGGFCLMLAALRRLNRCARIIHQQKSWDSVNPMSVFRKRVGFHGFGRVAQEFTRILQPFEVSIGAYCPKVPDEVFEAFGVKRIHNLKAVFAENDIVVELASLTEKTRNSVTEEMLRSIPPNGIFVNIGRAAVVEEKGLYRVAQEGNLFMGLDVLHKEPPPPDCPLRGLDNVVITPHNAGPTPDSFHFCGEYALNNLTRWVSNQPLEAVIDLERFDGLT